MILINDYNYSTKINPLEKFDSELDSLIQSNAPDSYASITKITVIPWGSMPIYESPSQHYDEISE